MHPARDDFGCGVLGDLIYGASGSDKDEMLSTFERYSIAQNTWESLPKLMKPRKNLGQVYYKLNNRRLCRIRKSSTNKEPLCLSPITLCASLF